MDVFFIDSYIFYTSHDIVSLLWGESPKHSTQMQLLRNHCEPPATNKQTLAVPQTHSPLSSPHCLLPPTFNELAHACFCASSLVRGDGSRGESRRHASPQTSWSDALCSGSSSAVTAREWGRTARRGKGGERSLERKKTLTRHQVVGTWESAAAAAAATATAAAKGEESRLLAASWRSSCGSESLCAPCCSSALCSK